MTNALRSNSAALDFGSSIPQRGRNLSPSNTSWSVLRYDRMLVFLVRIKRDDIAYGPGKR